jgi:hypothetical protein
MATAEKSPAESGARPFQFTLRQLLWLMGAVCVLSGGYYWLGSALPIVLFAIACVAAISYIAYHFTNEHVGAAIAVTVVVCLFIAMQLPYIYNPGHPSRRMSCQNNLHNLALALQNYHDVYGSFPPAYVADENGKPMHSWRVLILPFIEQKALYEAYRFDEPWDGPNNSKLHGIKLQLYSCPSDPSVQSGIETNYVAVVGPRTMWPGEKATKMSDIKDGTSNTLLIVETHGTGIHWMEPLDLDAVQMSMAINPAGRTGIASMHPTVAQGAFVDGSVRALAEDTALPVVRAMLTIDGGEKVEAP